MADKILKLEKEGGDILEARIHPDLMMRLMIEVEDSQGARGAVVRTVFMPSKPQAESLGAMLLEWARAERSS